MTEQTRQPDRIERLDAAEMWMREGLRVAQQPGFFVSNEVEMTRCKALIEDARARGIRLTYTHLFVKAVALVLARHPDLHQLISGSRKLLPGSVDIGLSVSGTTVVAPVIVIEDAAGKSLEAIADEVARRAPEVREEQEKMLGLTRRWGWLIPFGWLRRLILRQLIKQFGFQRAGVGTFQVSCLAEVDQFVPFLFSTAAILGTGKVRERAVIVGTEVVRRPTAILSCCADHKVWDGMGGALFLKEVKQVIESGTLLKLRGVE